MPATSRVGRGLASAVACLGIASCAAAESETEPRPAMHQIFEAIAVLLPASLDEHGFEDPLHRDEIAEQLRVLEGSVDQLEAHAAGEDAGFRYLSRSLSRDVADLTWQFEHGQLDAARYQLIGVTQNCVACHSRLPRARDFPLADRLVGRVEISSLDRVERARLQVAVRRFDGALADWEAYFADRSVPPERFDVSGDLVEYLTVAIRVQRDPDRARRGLDVVAARPDVPAYLRRHVEAWTASLGPLRDEVKAEPSLARARRLVAQANDLSLFPAGRERLVYDLVASSVLHRTIAAAPAGDTSVAEAYYLLGVIEARSVDSWWVPQTELHLEAAIRADPHGPYAQQAYAMLEEYIVMGYGGLSRDLLPADVAAQLAELRGLISGPGPAPADGGGAGG